MKLLILFLEDVLVVFDLLEFVLGGCDGRGLVADDVLQRADQFPHLLGGDSTGWIRGANESPLRVRFRPSTVVLASRSSSLKPAVVSCVFVGGLSGHPRVGPP